MKKLLLALCAAGLLSMSVSAVAEQAKGLNVMVTSADRQTQMMAMVLSLQTIKKHGKAVNMVLCGSAGDLALKDTKTEPFKPSGKSPTMLLNKIISMGASVQVCPLYLPNADKAPEALIDGITVAKPPIVAGKLLDADYRILTY